MEDQKATEPTEPTERMKTAADHSASLCVPLRTLRFLIELDQRIAKENTITISPTLSVISVPSVARFLRLLPDPHFSKMAHKRLL